MTAPSIVLFDAMGVLYRRGNVVGGVLLPYLRAAGCTLPDDEIRAVYRECTLGRISTGALWQALGVAGAADDEDYCQRHELTDGVHGVLAKLRGDGFTLACLTNDTAAWSRLLRRRFGLDDAIGDWYVSSDLGGRKPDPAPFRSALAGLAVPPRQVVFVDDRPVNLATAQALGMRTVLFHSDDTAAHPAGIDGTPAARTMAELYGVLTRLRTPA